MIYLKKYLQFGNNKLFFAIFSFFIAVNVIINLLIRLFPFIDLPFHLAVGTIFKFYGSEGNLFSSFYLIPSVIKSNIFHLLFINIPFFSQVETANKVFYILYCIFFPVSVLILIKILKGNIWFSLLSFFYVYNFVCAWGFTGNTISVPFFIVIIAFYYKYFYTKKNIYLFLIFITNLLIFFSHFQTAIYSLVVFFVLSLLFFEKKLKYVLKLSAVIIPVALLMTYVYCQDSNTQNEGLVEYILKYFKFNFLSSLFEKLQLLFINEHYHWAEEPFGGIIGAVISLIVVIPLFAVLFNKNFRNNTSDAKKVILYSVIFSSLFFYFALPFDIPGQNIVSYRFSIYFFIGLILLLSIQNFNQKFLRNYLPVLVISVMIFTGYTAEYFIAFQNENENFNEELFSDLRKTDRLGGLIYVPDYRGRPVYIHFNNYYTVWNKGISTGYVDYRFAFIKRKVDEKILPPPNEWIAVFNKYNDEFSNIEFILTRDSVKRDINNFKPEKSVGKWILYKNINLINK